MIRFLRAARSFARNETAEVVAVDGCLLTLRRADGSIAALDPSRLAASFDVEQARALPVAAGDVLLLQANHGRTFINGERVCVRSIHNGRITLTDGRQLPAGFNTFTHGYAVTSHSSQGKTVDEVLLVASSRSFAAVNREQFYVSISRGRQRVHIFTDDAELLARRVIAGGERKAAVEMVAQRQQLRQDLARLGFSVPEHAQTDPRSTRVGRSTRLHHLSHLDRQPPVLRLIQAARAAARWISRSLRPDRVAQSHLVRQPLQPDTARHSRRLGAKPITP